MGGYIDYCLLCFHSFSFMPTHWKKTEDTTRFGQRSKDFHKMHYKAYNS